MRVLTTFSRTFDTKGEFDTGLFTFQRILIQTWLFNRGLIIDLSYDLDTYPGPKEMLMIFITYGRSSDKQDFNNHLGIESSSQNLSEELSVTFFISYSEAGVNSTRHLSIGNLSVSKLNVSKPDSTCKAISHCFNTVFKMVGISSMKAV